jgi:carboxymethylenebutenolidase
MRRTLVALTAVLLFAPSGLTAAEVKTSTVKFKSGDGEASGFLAVPEGKGPFPAIVVIQDFFGVDAWVQGNAKRFAEKGYVALAVDLYHGKVGKTGAEAGQLMRALQPDRALSDLKGATSYLAGLDNVDKKNLGCIGWCMGGGYSLKLALADEQIKACVICYGRLVTTKDAVKPLKAAVLGIFAGNDRGIPPKGMVDKFEAALKDAGKTVEAIKVFEGSNHGFMRSAKDSANAKQAWEDVDKFFAKTLKGK